MFVKKRKKSASDIQQGTLHCLETVKSTQHGPDRNDCTPEDHVREWSFDRLVIHLTRKVHLKAKTYTRS